MAERADPAQSSSQPERWWMLRYPSGVVRMATDQDDEAGTLREVEAREVGARLFRVVREQDHADVVERLTVALALLRGHVRDDDGWRLINDALWLGPRDENDEPIHG